MSYLKIASELRGHVWTPEQVNIAYDAFVGREFMEENCRVLKPDHILRVLSVDLDGWIRHEGPNYVRKLNEIEIEKWHNPRTKHTHFIVGSPFRWDPLGDSVTVREGELVGKIVVRVPNILYKVKENPGPILTKG